MKQILIRLLANSGLQRGILLGIARYSRLHGPWRFLVAARTDDAGIFRRSSIEAPDIDGMLLSLGTQAEVEQARSSGVPFVCMTHMEGVPMVSNDNYAIGRMGAEHLVNQGYRHLAFVGPAYRDYLKPRMQAFIARAEQAGAETRILEVPPSPHGEIGSAMEQLHSWMLSAGQPWALMADTDVQAHRFAEAALAMGISIPERLAILGVENDEPICEVTTPSLSSVSLNAERIGYEGAAMLGFLMAGRKPESRSVFVPPLGIERRQSTSELVVNDPEVAAALNYIRSRPREPLATTDILRVVSIGRRMLERRFRQATGRTIFQEIRRVQLEQVKQLLRETSWEIEMVARRSAFASAKRLREVFGQAFGESPTEYRQRRSSGLR